MFVRCLRVAFFFLSFFLFFFLFYLFYLFYLFHSCRPLAELVVKEAVDVPHRVTGVFRSILANPERLARSMQTRASTGACCRLLELLPVLVLQRRTRIRPVMSTRHIVILAFPDGLSQPPSSTHHIHWRHRVALHASAAARRNDTRSARLSRQRRATLQQIPRAPTPYSRGCYPALDTCSACVHEPCRCAQYRLQRDTRMFAWLRSTHERQERRARRPGVSSLRTRVPLRVLHAPRTTSACAASDSTGSVCATRRRVCLFTASTASALLHSRRAQYLGLYLGTGVSAPESSVLLRHHVRAWARTASPVHVVTGYVTRVGAHLLCG